MLQFYHIAERPYGPIDALNRMAAALGSPRYGQLAAHADYNGHRVELRWNDYRQYYTCTYTWAGSHTLARGDFAECLNATLQEQDRGALGSSATIELRENDTDAAALCERSEIVLPGKLPKMPSFWTWKHEWARRSARDSANPRIPTKIFDWPLMQAAETEPEYVAALVAKYNREYHF